jgi:hypothetical protein
VLIIVLFRQALDEAIEKDRAYAERGVAEGPFWGLPSSFKGVCACVSAAGLGSVLGLVALVLTRD